MLKSFKILGMSTNILDREADWELCLLLMAPKQEKAKTQAQTPETPAEVRIEKPPVKPEEYLKKNIEFFKKHDDLKATEVFLKNGMASRETYQKAKRDYEKMRDEVSEMDLSEGLPDDFSGLATREDFERKLAESQPAPKTEGSTIENINPKMEPYSGKLRAGMEVKYEGTGYKLLGYDGQTGWAILGKERPWGWILARTNQEKLYAENQIQTAEAQGESGAEEETPTKRERSSPEMTLDEIEAKIKFAKDTGRVPGIGPEGLSYWQEQKRLYLEREKAEELERKIEELKQKLRQKYTELTQAVEQERAAEGKEYAIVEKRKLELERKGLQKEIDGLEKELQKLETNPDGKEWKKTVKNVYEKAKEKGRKIWGFLKERAKGFATFGLWELKEAEVMRRGTNKAEEEIKAIGQHIQEEEGLSEAEALKEAEEMRKALGETATKEQYQEISDKITRGKKEENEKVENDIINNTVETLQRRLESRPVIANYRSVHGGEKVLTDENVAALRAELAAELKKLRNGQIRKDRLNYASLMRKNLDPKWWARYIYGPAEMVLMGIGVKYLVTKLLAEKAAAAGKAAAGSQEALEVGLKDTVWGEAKRQLVSHGVLNPTNTQIQQVATVISKESAVNVPPWQLAGEVLHTKMQAGYLLKLKGALVEIAKIKAAL